MKFESEHERLREKLKYLKEIINLLNSDIVTLINLSAQVENNLRLKKKITKKQSGMIEEKIINILKNYSKIKPPKK